MSPTVPLCAELMTDDCKVYFTHVYQAQHSSLFQPTSAPPLSEKELRETVEAEKGSTRTRASEHGQPRTFEFRPRFEDIAARIDTEEGRRSDTWVRSSILLTPCASNPLTAKLRHRSSPTTASPSARSRPTSCTPTCEVRTERSS